MISSRTRGLVRLYAAATVTLAVVAFLGYLAVLRSLFGEGVATNLPSGLYLLGITAGMLGGLHLVTRLGVRLGRLTWRASAALATRQIAWLAAILLLFVGATRSDLAAGWPFVVVFLGLAWLSLSVLGAVLPRCLTRIAFRKARHVPTLFIGRVRAIQPLLGWAADQTGIGIHPVGFLSDEPAAANADSPTPHLGPVDRLGTLLQAQLAAQVIVVDLPPASGALHALVDTCQREGCRLLIYSDLTDQFTMPLRPIFEGGHIFHAAHETPLEDPLNRLAKRLLDVGIALPVVTLILPPLSLWVWLMQRSQAPGSVFYIRARGGRNRVAFNMLKFRSMAEVPDAFEEETLPDARGDRRDFPFGRFLRRTGLNEIPQFVNVLLGHMSIVGPRPHLTKQEGDLARLDRTYRMRALVKPGITGLAQVRGFRGECQDRERLHERLELDLHYLTAWSLRLDVELILRTAWQMLSLRQNRVGPPVRD